MEAGVEVAVESGSSPVTLEARLAKHLLTAHPERAVVTLERLGVGPCAAFLAGAEPADVARAVLSLAPQFAVELLAALPVEQSAAVLVALAPDAAVRFARQLEGRVEPILERLPEEAAEAIRAQLAFPADTAGGLMDARVLALPQDLSAAEALTRVRDLSSQARYNLYVVDREQHLVGVLNLRELLLAPAESRLDAVMVRNPHRLRAGTRRDGIASHPGWRSAHSMPVVDDEGHYLGAIRYRTMRQLEDLHAPRTDSETPQALGELLAVGAGGFLRALTASAPPDEG